MQSSKNFKYSFLSKIFHKFLLNSNEILKVFFEIEKKFFLKKIRNTKTQSLFITGLPRSGSTILLNTLYKTNLFSSLKYSDMPFITSINLWSKIKFFKKDIKSKERAHKDGIKINAESPEAFEEVFWRSQLNFKDKDKLIYEKNNYSKELIKNFEDFIKLIIYKNRKPFYLSKNNSNIIRIDLLAKNLSNKKIIILFRNPLNHCFSMFQQHINFIKSHKSDKFNLSYMNMLSHYEFGLNHKPFFLSNFNSKYKPENINYWLEYWVMIYTHLLKEKKNKDVIFLSYESLINSPELIIKKILNILNIDLKVDTNEIHNKNKSHNYNKVNKEILLRANILYEEIKIHEIKT